MRTQWVFPRLEDKEALAYHCVLKQAKPSLSFYDLVSPTCHTNISIHCFHQKIRVEDRENLVDWTPKLCHCHGRWMLYDGKSCPSVVDDN
jgi:hypothetical protein